MQAQLDRARRLRLLRDQWTVRRAVFRDYPRHVGSEGMQLVKLQPSLEAIRRLEGPDPPSRTLRTQARRRLEPAAADADP